MGAPVFASGQKCNFFLEQTTASRFGVEELEVLRSQAARLLDGRSSPAGDNDKGRCLKEAI